jgi:hypothetical protein
MSQESVIGSLVGVTTAVVSVFGALCFAMNKIKMPVKMKVIGFLQMFLYFQNCIKMINK